MGELFFYPYFKDKKVNYTKEEVADYLESMARLNIKRQNELEPKRLAYALERLTTLTDCDILEITDKRIVFKFKNEKVILYPYSGYFNGKSVKAGRGFNYLLQQIQNK